MSDLYSELLVKKEPTAKDSIVKYGMIVLTVLAVGAGLFISPILLLVAVALGVASYFVIPRTDLEYEYLFVNGEFDIDMVMSKSKRKKVMSMNLREADLVAPLDSHSLISRQNDRMICRQLLNCIHRYISLLVQRIHIKNVSFF